jgi:hypothetical protein
MASLQRQGLSLVRVMVDAAIAVGGIVAKGNNYFL